MAITPISRRERTAWPLCRCALRWATRHARPICRLILLVFLVALGVGIATQGDAPEWIQGTRELDGGASLVLALSLLYAALLALPFVPAIELGLLVMVLFGKPGAVIAWLATVAGLNLAYGCGRCLGPRLASGSRARLPEAVGRHLDRLAATRSRALAPALTLALLLNMPGNTAVGGGGGIALVYGATRSLSWPLFAAIAALATSFVPLLFLLGIVSVEQFLQD